MFFGCLILIAKNISQVACMYAYIHRYMHTKTGKEFFQKTSLLKGSSLEQKEDKDYSVVCSDPTRDNRHRLKCRTFHLSVRKIFLYCEEDRILERTKQRGCGISTVNSLRARSARFRDQWGGGIRAFGKGKQGTPK